MAYNVRTPGAGTPRALGNVCLAADDLRDNPRHVDLQARRITARLKCSPALAAAIAELAFASVETWRAAR